MFLTGQRFAMMSMKVGLAQLLRKQRLVACDKTNMGKLEVLAVLNTFYLFLGNIFTLWKHEISIKTKLFFYF